MQGPPSISATLQTKIKPIKYINEEIIKMKYPTIDGARIIWNKLLGINYDVEAWQKVRVDSYQVLIVAKLRYFQVRLLSNKITTNSRQSKWDSTISAKCNLCFTEDTVLHVLYHCKKAQTIWKAAIRWLDYISTIQIELDEKLVILNNYKGSHAKMVNTIILLVK